MKVLIIYDSTHGNTEKIAKAIGNAITGEAKILRAAEAKPADFKNYDLLIVGSPTEGGRPTKPVQALLNSIGDTELRGIPAAVFDTRLSNKLVGIFGYAAGKITESLTKKGAGVLTAEGFFVTKEPLLKEGELERAGTWANDLVQKIKK